MKKTVVLSPYINGVSGTLEQEMTSESIRIHIVLNHSARGEDSILRLYALSTSHAAKKPYLAEIFDADARDMTACIRREDIVAVGYSPENIDTYLLTEYTSDKEKPLAGAFLGLEWCAARFLQQKNSLISQEGNCADYEPNPGTPLNRARELLSERQGERVSDERIDALVYEFGAEVSKYSAISFPGNSLYRWYRIDKDIPVGNLSSVTHIVTGSRTRSALRNYGYYIIGILSHDGRHIAVGIPSDRQNCPVPQVSDCSEFLDGYHITGIFLANDGQYFEKYLQN